MAWRFKESFFPWTAATGVNVTTIESVDATDALATAAAAGVLATPAQKLATDASGYVTFNNSSIAVSGTVQVNATTGWGGSALPTTFAVSDKTGFALASTGLDSISAAEPTAKPTTFAGWVMWLVQCFRAGTLTADTKLVKTEAGATVTTQTVADDGTTETLGPPT